jgi:hypothetical protein
LGYLKEFLRKKLKSAKKVTKLPALTVRNSDIVVLGVFLITVQSRLQLSPSAGGEGSSYQVPCG